MSHTTQSSDRRRLPLWGKVAASVVGSILVAALAFAIIQPVKVLPRIRLAPGYALEDQSGETFTSETAREGVTLYNFAPVDCGNECDSMNETITEIRERVQTEVDLEDTELRFVTITLSDSPDSDVLAESAAAAGADGEQWRWVAGEWDQIRTVVGSGFETYFEKTAGGELLFDPAFALVDAEGIIRGEYRYETRSSNADKLVRQIGVLGDEIRYSHGAAAAAYEAAHLFLCYD